MHTNMRRLYHLWISAEELNSSGIAQPDKRAFAFSNDFQIYGAPKLYPKEIAGIVVGVVVVVALMIVAFTFGARLWRKRRSAAVSLSEAEHTEEGRYRD